ncbi:hypothetical protein J3E69DRAFT_325645 [Trichoderma sp. SZMC 28015]
MLIPLGRLLFSSMGLAVCRCAHGYIPCQYLLCLMFCLRKLAFNHTLLFSFLKKTYLCKAFNKKARTETFKAKEKGEKKSPPPFRSLGI